MIYFCCISFLKLGKTTYLNPLYKIALYQKQAFTLKKGEEYSRILNEQDSLLIEMVQLLIYSFICSFYLLLLP